MGLAGAGRRSETRPGGLGLLALVGPLLLTVWGTHLARDRVKRGREERFARAAEQIREAVETHVRGYEQLLRGCAALFAARDTVDREEWAAYVSALSLGGRYPAIRALAYVTRVPQDGGPAFEASARAAGLDVRIHPPSDRQERFVVTYAEPVAANLGLLGLDLASEPVRREALESARDLAQPVMTPRLALTTDPQKRPAFLLVVPVYARGVPVASVAERRRHSRGWVVAAARTEELISTLPLPSTGLDVEIFDGSSPRAESLLFDNKAPLQPPVPTDAALAYSGPLAVGGRRWTMRVVALPEFESSPGLWHPGIVLAAGGTASLLLFAFVWSLASTRRGAIDRADRMTQALRASEQHLRAVMDTVADAIVTFDQKGRIQTANRAAERLFGMRQEELGGRPLADVLAGAPTFPGGRSEAQARRGDGRTVPVEVALTRMEGADTLVATLSDISERRAAESALRTSDQSTRSILENMLGGLITIDESATIESVNPAAEAIFGYSAAELVGRNLAVLVPESVGDRKAYLRQAFVRAIGRASEWQGRRKSGEVFPFELSMFEFQTTGTGRHFAGNIRDLSERHAVEKLKQEFVSTVSHELRTPLTSIRGSLGLLAGGVLGELSDEAREMVVMAERNCARLIALVNDILDLERLQHGRLKMELADVPLAPVLSRARESVQEFANQRQVRLEAAATDLVVRADEGRLVQVLVNLLANAVKFSPPAAAVTVAVRESGGRARVEVIDHGRGVPASHRTAIFERFRQVESSDAREKGGTGLGLAISKVIVEEHGGEIGVESEEGRGSTFWFEVPVATEDQLLGAFRMSDGPPDVLLADSDEALLGVLVRQLVGAGVRVQVATSGEEAESAIRASAPRLLVLDLGLPGGEGGRLLDHLRADERMSLLPLLVYAERDIDERLQIKLLLGPTRFLTKSRATDAEVRAAVLDMLAAEAGEAHS